MNQNKNGSGQAAKKWQRLTIQSLQLSSVIIA